MLFFEQQDRINEIKEFRKKAKKVHKLATNIITLEVGQHIGKIVSNPVLAFR